MTLIADLDKETRHDLARLRIRHDNAVIAIWRAWKDQGMAFEDIARDPELVYHLDALDAINAYYNPEECLA